MAYSWTAGSGSPADSLGVDTDFYRDFTNRIDWGPKGRITAGSWQGTAQSNIGGTGLGILSYVGVPPPSFGLNGNSAVDVTTALLYTKANNVWTQTGSLPIANTQPSLGSFSASYGQSYSVNNFASTATPATMPLQGTTLIAPFTAPANCAFMGYQLTSVSESTASFTIALVNITPATPTTLFSVSVARGTVNAADFIVTQYPMIEGNQYVWRISGAGTAFVAITPKYLFASTTPTSVSNYANFVVPSGVTLSATAFIMTVPGATSPAFPAQYYKSSKPASIFSTQFIVGPGTGSVKFTLVGGAAYTMTVAANSTTTTVVNDGPLALSAVPLLANTSYTWTATGTTALQCAVNMQVVQ